MKHLYAPWRSNYTESSSLDRNENTLEQDCRFCIHFKADADDSYFILKRFKHMIVMFNIYPYNAGHLLILPIKHSNSLNALSPEARIELMELTNTTIEILKKAFNPAGFNIGLNIGKVAGAGLPSHLHQHVLPRFIGDTNFLPTLGATKAISFDLHAMFKQLKPLFDEITT